MFRSSSALRLYVCNVATQTGETQGYDLADHFAALERHVGPGVVDIVLANSQFEAKRPGAYSAEAVRLRWPPERSWPSGAAPRLMLDDVVDPENAHHHDPARLAASIMAIYEHESLARRRPRSSARSA